MYTHDGATLVSLELAVVTVLKSRSKQSISHRQLHVSTLFNAVFSHDSGSALASPRSITSRPALGHVELLNDLLISANSAYPVAVVSGSPDTLSAKKTYTAGSKPGTAVFETAMG